MAEIKSAIELAMERTKNLVMSEEEKQKSAVREMEGRLRALLRRYVEGMIGFDDARQEYEGLKVEPARKRSIMIDLLVGEFDLYAGNDRLFDLLRMAGGQAAGPLGEEMKHLQREFEGQVEKSAAGVRKSVMERLKKMGITGSGVEPNLTEWDEWKESVAQTGNLFKKRLAEWKDKLKAARV